MNTPLSVLIQEAKGKVLTVINESGLPPALADLVLTSVLSDVRGQMNLEMLNYSKEVQSELEKKSKEKEGEG